MFLKITFAQRFPPNLTNKELSFARFIVQFLVICGLIWVITTEFYWRYWERKFEILSV
jgi:hypothetical protein